MTQNGLFWTTIVPANSVAVDVTASSATLEVSNLKQFDYVDFENAILGNGPRPKLGTVSFKVQWTATGPSVHREDAAQQFRGEFRPADAQMEWTARTPEFDLTSDPIGTSTTDFAQLGFESNGSFY